MQILWELIRKDLRQFAADRRALIIAFFVPVFIASFLALITGGSSSGDTKKMRVAIVVADADQSEVTKRMVERLRKNENVMLTEGTAEQAQTEVRDGKVSFGVVFPKGFGTNSVAAMHGGPQVDMPTYADPSKSTESQIVKGILAQAVMQEVIPAAFGGVSADGGNSGDEAFRLPYKENAQAIGGGDKTADSWSGSAHAFAGMAMQGLFFGAIEAAMGLLRERRLGLWRRLRSAPIRPEVILLARILSSAMRAALVMAAVFAFGIALFHFRINGSFLGFLLVGLAACLMTGCFGLFVAALGKTEQQSRGLSILAVLVMMMLGGAWFPAFLMPQWVQTISLAIPVRWAVDGFDAMTWRGLGLSAALPSVGVLLVFSVLFAAIAMRRMKWEVEG